MFTGIIEAQGEIVTASTLEKGKRLRIAAPDLDLSDVRIGDSIAVEGVCLTVTAIADNSLEFEVSQETLRCTAGFESRQRVNLEKALRLGDRLGGHLVTGHVDGVGEVARFERVAESWLLQVRAPPALARYIARKGSITINGVSLTVNGVNDALFDVNLIPHTIAVTTLQSLRVGMSVNLEIDLLARYLERLTQTP